MAKNKNPYTLVSGSKPAISHLYFTLPFFGDCMRERYAGWA